jgi:hypothetical protein
MSHRSLADAPVRRHARGPSGSIGGDLEAAIEEVLQFLDRQRSSQAPHFPTIRAEKVLAFMGTCSKPGAYVTVGVCPVVALETAGAGRILRVRLRGPLPRAPQLGERITVHLTQLLHYQGFQVKTPPLRDPGEALHEEDGADLVVNGTQVYTVHHSPYTMRFFEVVPFDEVRELVGGVRFALVGVGEQANLSPRFVWHSEVVGGRLALYHGDGLALKTYMNVKVNRHESRLVLDLHDYSGYVLRGTVEEFQPHQHPEAYQKICRGFEAGDWGRPARVFRFAVEGWDPIAPTAPAVRPARAG